MPIRLSDISEPGTGTTFKIHLPALTEPLALTGVATAAKFSRGNDELILLVDDELSMRLVTQQTLELFGYRVMIAEDGAEAVGIYAAHSAEIAVVVTDMMMPNMDGPTMIHVLQRINPEVRVIGTSGIATSDHITRITSLGVKEFLAKPYTAEMLIKALETVLSP